MSIVRFTVVLNQPHNDLLGRQFDVVIWIKLGLNQTVVKLCKIFSGFAY